ncbi:uracil-DNA glycosylase [Aquabacter spiritensis]|nr:uracil-DNA glycosylase [Aquabacter spiritensis]
MTNFSPSYIRDLLALHVEAGVDAALGDAPVNRFAAVPAVPRPVSPAPALDRPGHRGTPAEPNTPRPALSVPASMIAAQAPDEAVMAARELARTAASLDELRAMLETFEGCPLKRTATRLVFADGNPRARIMFVGEAPGRDEDIQGLPFVGRSGRLLDLMMAAIGLDRGSAYIGNVVPWRPPGNRTPTPQETAICLPFIRRQIELANPDFLICLGGPSAQTLLGVTEGITKIRGRFHPYDTGSRTIRAMPTFHPAYLLRTPLGKRLVWRDLLEIEAALAQPA